jgi:hypothetical protein
VLHQLIYLQLERVAAAQEILVAVAVADRLFIKQD